MRLERADRPFPIIEVQDGIHFHQIHVGLVVGVEGADVPPIGNGFTVLVAEAIGAHAHLLDHAGDDILAEIVIAIRAGGVLAKQLIHRPGGEHVNPHRRQAMVGVVGDGDRLLGFLQKAKDLILSIDLHETETGAVARRRPPSPDGQEAPRRHPGGPDRCAAHRARGT